MGGVQIKLMEDKDKLAMKFAAYEVDRYLVAHDIAITSSKRKEVIQAYAKLIVRSGLKPPYYFDTGGLVRTLQERKQRYEYWTSTLIKGMNDLLAGVKKPRPPSNAVRYTLIKNIIREGNLRLLADTKMTPSDLDKIATFLYDFEKSNGMSNVIDFLNDYENAIKEVEASLKMKTKRNEEEKKLFEHIGELVNKFNVT
jgi:hypothetical protein